MLNAVLGSLKTAEDLQVKTVIHPDLARAFPTDSQVPLSPGADLIPLAESFDILWPIAPETDRILWNLVRQARPIFKQVIAPDNDLIEMATDKKKTFEHLKTFGIPTPETFSPGQIPETGLRTASCPPWVLKRRDGAGSQDMRLLDSPAEASGLNPNEWILQPLVSGKPVSQAILGGPKGCWYCPPCFQTISNDGAFTYAGGKTPIPPDLAHRTRILSEKLVATIPLWRGWLGVDMILGDNPQDDRILEINPRLTTSFVGLNRAAGGALAKIMVLHSLGLKTVQPTFSPITVCFDASGNLTTS